MIGLFTILSHIGKYYYYRETNYYCFIIDKKKKDAWFRVRCVKFLSFLAFVRESRPVTRWKTTHPLSLWKWKKPNLFVRYLRKTKQTNKQTDEMIMKF